MLALVLASIPVLLVGAGLSLALRSNAAVLMATLVSQFVGVLCVLIGIASTLGGGTPIEATWAWSSPIDSIVFRLDALGSFFLAWSLPLTFLGTLYASGYLQRAILKGRRGGPHYALLNTTMVAFVLVYTAQNALVFLLGWEIAAVSAWLLVIWDYQNQRTRFAGFSYLVSTHVGLFVLVAAFMLLHSKTNSMDFRDFGEFLRQPTPARGTLFLLLGTSFAIKSAFFPFHFWLPRAHAAAPAHVSALMSGVIHKAGLFGLLRFVFLMGKPDEWMGWSVLTFGMVSAFFGVLYSTTQRDLKRLLGYSSTENVGIAAIGIGVGLLGWTWDEPALCFAGFTGGLLHILNHAIFKCLLFFAAGAVHRAMGTVDLERLGGLSKKMPRTAMLFLFGAMASCALPPLNGFVGEFVIYGALLSGNAPSPSSNVGLAACASVLAFVGAVSLLSMVRAFGIVFLGSPRETTSRDAQDPPRTMMLALVLQALGVLLFGLVPELGLRLLGGVLSRLPFSTAPPQVLEPLTGMLWASRGLAVLLFLAMVGRAWQAQSQKKSAVWACGYTELNSRMQYTGSSFSEQLGRVFDSFIPSERSASLPVEFFPTQPGHLATRVPDAVEQRVFEVVLQGEKLAGQTAGRISEQPKFAFAAGLIALALIGALALGTGASW
jgi:hydrogenase-4 component B